MPKFSVVISVYNKEKYIGDTLRSVLAQTFTDFEIIILNDGSTDNSEAEILKFIDARIQYFSKENMGASAARNYVIEKAKGEYIALLDADDYWFPFYLEEQNKAIYTFPEESIFATATSLQENNKIFENKYSIKTTKLNIDTYNYFDGSLITSLLHSSSTVINSAVFRDVGLYNPTIKSGEDTDLYIRIGLKYKVVFNPKVCAIYILRENSLFQTTKNINDRANFEDYENLEKSNKPLKRFLDINRYSLCIIAKLEGNTKAFKRNIEKIDLKNLSKRQQFLLGQNKNILINMMKTKSYLEKIGLRLGTFK